jgi:hypothetical protein
MKLIKKLKTVSKILNNAGTVLQAMYVRKLARKLYEECLNRNVQCRSSVLLATKVLGELAVKVKDKWMAVSKVPDKQIIEYADEIKIELQNLGEVIE